MSSLPSDRLYTETHEWLRAENDGTYVLGITDHAQSALGDVVFVEPRPVGTRAEAGASVAVVESVKAASDVYTPFAAEVVAVNDGLSQRPETLNRDPYQEGWILRLRPAAGSDPKAGLLDATAYAKLLEDAHD
jgi:glycine cleavage system H protein